MQGAAAGADQDDKLSTAYQDALAPLKAIRPDMFEQALGYVRSGTAPEVLTALDAAPTHDVNGLMAEPSVVSFAYHRVGRSLVDRVRTARPGWTIHNGVRARMKVHTTAPAAVVARLGRVLATVGEVERVAAGAPEWLTALVNDVASSREENSRAVRQELFARWTPEFLTKVAREGGVAKAEVVPAVLTALLHRDAVGSASDLERLTELVTSEAMAAFLAEHANVLPEVAETLAAPGKAALLGAVKRNLAPHAELVASLAVDPAKNVRAEATTLLATLEYDEQLRLLAPHLSTAVPSRLGEALGQLARVPGGLDAIRAALAAVGDARGQAARVKALQKTLDRAEALVGESGTETVIQVPPFELPKEFVLGDDYVAGALELLGREREKAAEKVREVVADGHQPWVIDEAKNRLANVPALTEEDLRAVVRLMNGETYRAGVLADGEEGRPSEAAAQWCLWHRSFLPATAPAHRLRLWFARGRRDVAPLAGEFLPDLRDLRAVEELFVQFGVDDPGSAVDQFVFRDVWYGERGQVDLMWPYYAERIDLLVPHLTPRESDDDSEAFSRALKIVAAFPVAPSAALPQLSSLALGEDKKYRQTAQDVLSTNLGVRGLAEQGLADGKAGIRISAAAWLTRIGDAAAVPALRAALKKERQEAGRAALLSALKALGDDISADLAPEVLLAEATKGLKKPVPANLDWFPFGRLPQLRWADGAAGPESLVPSEVLRWWVVLACKLKEPSGDGLFALYLSRLDEASRAELGSFVLSAWIAQDTIHPPVEQSKAHAESGAQHRYDEYQRMVQQYPGYYEALAAMSVEDHYRVLYQRHQAEYLGSAVKEKGLLALTVGMPGSDLAEAAQHYFKANKTRRAQAEALVRALAANGDRAAVQLLLAVSRRFRMYTVQEVATALAKDLADRRGWDADQLADRTVQTAGFDDDGILRLDLGSSDGAASDDVASDGVASDDRLFTGRITEKFTLELRSPEGKVVKALPPKRVSDDDDAYADAKKQLAASRKELKAVIALQTQRFAEAMCSERTWGADEWREFVLGHPLMSRLAARLVWVATLPDGALAGPQVVAFRPGDGGALIGVDDTDVVLPEDATVSVAHAVTLPAARSAALSSARPAALAADAQEVAAWRGHLADYEVKPLFDQGLGADAVVLPELEPGAREIADHQGWLSDSFSIRGRATKLGYQRAAAEDGGWFDAYTKEYPGLGVTAHIWFTGASLPEENIPAAVTELTFQSAEGWNDGRKIEDLPAALVAVSYQEYATVARAGAFDSEWAKKTRY
ncbi:DUF4132 domain-containing protein [Promicromonospora sp. AC04]|uniref:DUF4132 domain-containing protein n=1 Tax=Promicromonospora sp. AC04 TaxID=2135723 RepID=UPI0011B1FD3A|nr:DUF4132 domain-containing protein [Promicromonospora sp. AC04]